MGRNGQLSFWCGFCRQILTLHKKDLEAWDERFDHIDDQHFKKGEKIGKWYPINKDLPRELLENGGIWERSEAVAKEPDVVHDDDVHVPRAVPLTAAEAEHIDSDSSSDSDSDGKSPRHIPDTPPSAVSECHKSAPSEHSLSTTSISGSVSLSSHSTSRKMWYCVRCPLPPSRQAVRSLSVLITNTHVL